MRNTRFVLLGLIALTIMFVTTACKKEKQLITEPAWIELTPEAKNLVAASNEFAFDVFRNTWLQHNGEKNSLISPLSISYALGMTLNGARTETFDSIGKVLGFDKLSLHQINSSYRTLMPFLMNADPTTNIHLANSIWYRNEFLPSKPFLDTCTKYFDALIGQLDFNNPGSLATINNWVATNTNHKITELITSINPNDVMFLINAIYFKGAWTIPFAKTKTEVAPFYTLGGTKHVDMMNGEGQYKYFSHSDFSMIELDYGRTNFAMNILLPEPGKEIADIMALLSGQNFNSWTKQFAQIDNMKVSLPKFKFEYEKSLKDVLSDMGMGLAFSELADFSGISSSGQLFISEMKHKAFIDVNEHGTEAAAATSVGIGITSVPPAFIANRPFVLIIRERITNTILFIGNVYDPVY
jgi:serine protease inhibitor